MTNDLLSVVRARLPDRRKDLLALADACGVPPDTLVKLESGVTKDPRLSTVQPLLDHWGLEVRERVVLSTEAA